MLKLKPKANVKQKDYCGYLNVWIIFPAFSISVCRNINSSLLDASFMKQTCFKEKSNLYLN